MNGTPADTRHLDIAEAAEHGRTAEDNFNEMETAWHRAAAVADSVREIVIRLAGRLLKISCAGQAVADCIEPAFAHIREDGSDRVDGELLVWSGANGILPQLPVSKQLTLHRSHLAELSTDEIHFHYRPTAQVLCAVHARRTLAVCCMKDPATLPAFERGTPLRQALSSWLRFQGAGLVHAAGLGVGDDGLLLAGRSGSGKSTLALAALASPFLFAGDDYVAVRTGPGLPQAFSVYCSGKLEPSHRARFPLLAPLLAPWQLQEGEKSVMLLWPKYAQRLLSTFTVRAIVIPRVTKGRPELLPLSKPRALAALAPSTVLQNPTGDQDELRWLRDLIASVPTYQLKAGDDPADALRLLEPLVLGPHG